MFIRSVVVLFFFALSSGLTMSGSVPVILNHSETALAGDVIYLQGSGFGQTPFVQYSFNDSNWRTLIPLTAGNGMIMVKIPATELALPDLLAIRASADNSNWSQSIFINRARAFSMDTDQVASGSKFRIFGRNLFFNRPPTVRFSDSATGQQLAATVDTSNSRSYLLQVTAPAGIATGHNYALIISNGYSGTQSSLDETIAEQQLVGRPAGVDYWQLGVPWAADLNYFSNVYNIQSDPRLSMHSQGAGASDDTNAINSAVWTAANAGGGVVYLPAGTYNLHYSNGCGISLQNRVVVMGAGMSQTVVNYGFGVAPSSGTGYGACFASQSGYSDLTLNNVNESGNWPESGLASGSTEVFLQRVKWVIGTSQWANFNSINHLVVQNSTFYQGIDAAFNFNGVLNLSGSRWSRVSDNTINFAVGGILMDRTQDMVFERNTVTRDLSITPDPHSVTHTIAASFATNFIILGNKLSSSGTSLPTQNDGEVINTEGGGPQPFDNFKGIVSASTALTLSDAAQNFSQSQNVSPSLRAGLATVAIVSGEGTGQYRQITAVSNDLQTLTIDHPWDVQPQAGSHYATFDWSARRWIIAENQLTNNFKGIEFFNACSSDILIESNTLTDSSGIMLSPTQQMVSGFNITWGIEIISNTIADVNGLRPAYVAIVPREDNQTTSFGTSVLGVEVRANNVIAHVPNVLVNNPSYDDYKARVEGFNCYWQWQTSWSGYDDAGAPPPLLGTIFQGNKAQNSATAILLNTGAAQTVFSDTMTQGVESVKNDSTIPGAGGPSAGTLIVDSLTNIPMAGSDGDLNSIEVGRSLTGNSIGVGPVLGQAGRSAFRKAESSSSANPDITGLLSRQIGGDADAIVHVNLGSSGAESTTGILMMRSLMNPSSPFVSVGRTGAGNLVVTYRTTFGGLTKTLSISSLDQWLRLVKRGSHFHVFHSEDGSTWSDVGLFMSEFTSRLFYVGMTEMSSDASDEIAATFSNFSIAQGATMMPVVTGGNAASTQRPTLLKEGTKLLKEGVGTLREFVVVVWKVVRKVLTHIV